MSLVPRVLILLLNFGWLLGAAFAFAFAPPPPPLAKPLCDANCGNVSVPYPFGTTEKCSLNGHFKVTCNRISDPPKLYFGDKIEITNISLSPGELWVTSYASSLCYSQQEQPYNMWMELYRFFISNTRNKFNAVGCNTFALIADLDSNLYSNGGTKYKTGCLSLCDSNGSVSNDSCSGIGCCQTTIPKGVKSFNITVQNYVDNMINMSVFNPCSYAFVAEENAYEFSSVDLYNFNATYEFPLVLDWTVGSENCSEAVKNQTSYACKDNSYCVDYDSSAPENGYRCFCSNGYEGNPYLPSGCTDINECEVPISCNMTCLNLPGTYNCYCPVGYEGDGKIDGTGCSPISVPGKRPFPWVDVALAISISISVLLLGGSWLYWVLRHRKIIRLREMFFEQNGGILLQERLSKPEGSVQAAKIFSSDDLKKATNNYHESQVIGRGGQGTVYKGVLPDNREVAIKKSQITDQSQIQIQQFINEVIILSQINHRNVVKLLGCCLETQVPLLVYEFVTNGSLYDHIHNKDHNKFSMNWENRLRVATETAAALSYLHSAASTPIIHRDVKSANILLDDNYVAKVSDFGASKLVPIDQTQLTTLVQGTLGYLDPEYFHTCQLTEKSDVYSFGVLLAELLTGKKALSFDRPAKEQSLALHFVSAMKDDCLVEIVEEQVIKEAKVGQLKEVAILAKRCLKVKGTERPTMKEVASELEGMRLMGKHPWADDKTNLEEAESLLGEIPNRHDDGASGGSPMTVHDSMTNLVISPFDGGR